MSALFLLLFFNQSVFSQYPIAPDKSARDDTENITADDLNKPQNIFSQPELGIQSLLEPTATFINFDDIIFYQENAIEISRNRYAGVSFYSTTQFTDTWLTTFQRYSYPNSLVVGYTAYPYTNVYSVDNLTVDFAQPSKDIAFLWGRDGSYSVGQLLAYDYNNQLVANILVNFGYATWVNIPLNQYSQRITKIVLIRPYVYDNRYGHIYLENFQFQPNPFFPPVGSLNSVSTTAPAGVVGWSVDPDNPSASNNVDCYVDGIIGQGRFIGRVLANNPSPPGVPYSGNHGFFTPLPTDLRDGNQHQMYCYGIDIIGGAAPTLLTGSPKTFTWNLDSTVEFSNLPPLVEKYSLETLNVTVRNLPNPNDTTRLTFRTTNGTGVAKFINSSNQLADEIVITGNVMNQAVRILAVTESSQANNLVVEARVGNSTTVKASHIFTIATITSLVFEKFDMTYTDLDNNGQPLIASQRIFPDKNDSADQTDRSLVKVKATVSPAIPNVQIYFANFDLDDPSANVAPIDTNGSAGNDNNGSVMIGTMTSTAGQLSLFSMPTGCSATVGKANCVTGADGTLTVQFKTTMQPGDNFAIAASLSNNYRNDLIGYQTEIITNGGLVIHISGEENFDESPGIRTKMLTVWRRLHIEVDSMGVVQGNFVEGIIEDEVEIPRNETSETYVSPTPDIALEVNRFEGGRLFVNGSSLPLDCILGRFDDDFCNNESRVKVKNTGFLTINIPPNSSFTLYDDDNFNDDGVLDGDFNEDIPMPPTSLLTAGSNNPDPSLPNTNVFAAAYIHPVYDIGDSNNNVPFVLNLSSLEPNDIRSLFDIDYQNGVNTNRDDGFWTVYILGAYQGTLTQDGDPFQESPLFGTADEITGLLNGEGSGALIFFETNRPKERTGYTAEKTNPKSMAATVAHEVAHLFSCLHGDGGLMGNDPRGGGGVSSQLSPPMIKKIRGLPHP